VQQDVSTPVLSLIESRYDWITATAHKDTKGGDLFEFGINQVEADAAAGAQKRGWYFQGYSGFHAGNWSVGWGANGAIVVASQEGSEIGYRTLATLADHWSRCDVCVTGVAQDDSYDPVEQYWDRVKPSVARPASAPIGTILKNSRGGSTFYLGQRSAAFYLRVYNKHVESDGEYPPNTWRFELELKRHASEFEHGKVRSLGHVRRPPTDVIATELQRQQLPVLWRNNAPIERAKMPPRRKEVERTLLWLSDQVAPSVEYAVRAAGAKRTREALRL
jgi:hypothetical protein